MHQLIPIRDSAV